MKKTRKHKVGGKKKRSSKKMPDHVLAHFAHKTLSMLKRRGLKPALLPKSRKRRRE